MSTPSAPESPSRCYALVPCAGVGERAGVGGPKQYHPVAGVPVVAHTLNALRAAPHLTRTLVVLAPDDTRFEHQVPGFDGWVARCGGATRAESVLGGLAELRLRGVQASDWVLVHDAARCLLQPAWIERLIDACQGDAVGGLLALPVADTLKAEADGRVQATVDRRGKWAAQTPQMFRLELLETALRQAGPGVTDEASAIEALGLQPLLVRGDIENVKVTWPGDFALAERLIRTRPPMGEGAPSVAPGVGPVLHALEARLLDPTHHADPGLAVLLAPDFTELGENGHVLGRDAVLQWLASPARPYFRISDFSAVRVSDEVYSTRYLAHQLAVEVEKGASWRSGLWRHEAGRWQLVFHQGTRVHARAAH